VPSRRIGDILGMERDRLARLTEQQRICLRLVYAHLTSKQIAPMMGIEPGSVDQHIKAAMRVLDVPDRRTAARMLADHEAQNGIQPLVYQPLEIAAQPDPVKFEGPVESGQPFSVGASGGTIRVEQANFHEEQAGFRIVPAGGASTPPLSIGNRSPGDLNWLARLGLIAAIAIGVALAFGALLSAAEALSRLAKG
jgi:DNA-binding CsgD family transcriptional regulator